MKYTLGINGPQAHTIKGHAIAVLPREVYDDQRAFNGRTFPVILIPAYGRGIWKPRRARATLRGDLYGLNTSGTGDPIVAIR